MKLTKQKLKQIIKEELERTEIDFEGVEVEGSLVRPQGALILDRKVGSFNPLIRLRMDFEPELNNSVNLIK